ncbi:SAF domain-containing protein [uncultured Cellulomonas sp.]|uniref:SAF domain-containing protein n=1 Tax=uncultured Cellulomonas sp. TaxID=189682 RepID=UPI0028E6C9BF|nr:SAF domain-containing protein [uncultured Cellulomonas sp.]
MTATSEKSTLNGAPARAELRAPRVVATHGRRRPLFVVAGIVMVVIGALAAVWLVSSSGHRVDVVVMAADVPYGAPITADDLATTAVAVDPAVETVPAGDAREVVGQVAAAFLAKGTLLARTDVTSAGVVGPGQVLVPLPLPVERVPAGGLTAGEALLVVDAPPHAADPVDGTPKSIAATVARVGAPDINGLVVADVVAAVEDGPALATRAATGRFALVVLPAQGSK